MGRERGVKGSDSCLRLLLSCSCFSPFLVLRLLMVSVTVPIGVACYATRDPRLPQFSDESLFAGLLTPAPVEGSTQWSSSIWATRLLFFLYVLGVHYYINTDRYAYGGVVTVRSSLDNTPQVRGAEVFALNAECTQVFYEESGSWKPYRSARNIRCTSAK